jgi:hypothetical protein
MPISRFLSDRKLNPEQTEFLNAAFNLALQALQLVDRNDPICEIVARKVIEIGVDGVGDPQEVANAVVKELGPP